MNFLNYLRARDPRLLNRVEAGLPMTPENHRHLANHWGNWRDGASVWSA